MDAQDSFQLYGAEAMKPNFHWVVHLWQQILDYGPVYNFWEFLSEQLNKVLKSSNSNNWMGRQVETSMMREFVRGAQIDSLAQGVYDATNSLVVKGILQCMINNSQEASGTVQDAATETAFDELASYLHVQPGPTVSSLQ
ncbi:hypothetical protein PAXRUDRAFT_13493 [Paxillus rubicundulus Ve08.2h10]|uniref:Uncharacterized protein n=1 Tax=Paxillus rubicundulus Ve08.2h10 TaxID=930991 RepID=A0A0D0DYZ3_9AGAM|nr:hypothetical protein PAXRUDRAFT_13493 [Paxillus rubicundulus Ve08.2h10]